MDAPDIVDDFYLNLLDWGSSNVLAIALENTVYLWDASNGSTSELVTVDDESGPVTSVCWAPDGRHIAIGLNNSHVQLWDSTANKQVLNYISTLKNFLIVLCSKFKYVVADDLFGFVNAVEDIERRSQAKSRFTGLEQSHPNNRRNGW